jgi:5'-nucleotidase
MTHSTLLNVNIPNLSREQVKGIRITKLGNRNYNNLFEERKDPRGNTYYWMGGGIKEEKQHEESDVSAVEQGFISITPVHLDLTDYRLMEEYRKQGYHLETILL